MKKKLLALVLLAAGSMFAIEIGIHIGAPPPPRIVHVRIASPGPGYAYVEGYWYPVGGHYHWHAGYWSRPPYEALFLRSLRATMATSISTATGRVRAVSAWSTIMLPIAPMIAIIARR